MIKLRRAKVHFGERRTVPAACIRARIAYLHALYDESTTHANSCDVTGKLRRGTTQREEMALFSC